MDTAAGNRKKILIFSTDSFLAYQPSILNLYDALLKHFEVRIVAFNYYNRFVPVADTIDVTYLKPPRLLKKLLFGFDKLMNRLVVPLVQIFNKKYSYQNDLFNALKVRIGKRYLCTTVQDEVIAVDFVALAAAQEVFDKVHLQALEIYPADKYKPRADLSRLKSVISPSEERYEYNFGSRQLNKFIIPNAPTYKEYQRTAPDERKGLIWAGTISPQFGAYHVIDFVAAHPAYRLTLKGSFVQGYEALVRERYADLISSGRLIINTEYLENDAFITFISSHRIGFCFYEWEMIKKNINYLLAPAGRLFMYYAAGVPTIGCNTPGLKSVRDFNAGRLIDDYSRETILKAIEEIEACYDTVADNSISAAKAFSFNEATEPFIAYLKLSA